MQAHSWSNQLSDPNYFQIISQAYISLLLGYDGILYWTSGPAKEGNCIYPQYTYNGDMPYDQYMNLILNPTQIQQINIDKKEAINKVASLLNTPINEIKANGSSYTTVGDLLKESTVLNSAILGNSSPINNFTDFTIPPLSPIGNVPTCAINTAEIVKFADGTTLLDTASIIGINGFTNSNMPNGVTYFMLTNLNNDILPAKARRIRLNLFSHPNPKTLLRVTAINALDQVNGRLYSNNGLLNIIVPAAGAIILKVENYSTDENINFPKKTRFGVIRKEGGYAKVILDTDFFSASGAAEQKELDIPNTSNQVFPIDINRDTYTDFGALNYYVDNGGYHMSIDVYNQTSNSFSLYKHLSLTLDYPHTFILTPVSGDFNSDGYSDDFGWVINFGVQYKTYIIQQYYLNTSTFGNAIHITNSEFSPTTAVKFFFGKYNNQTMIFAYSNSSFYIYSFQLNNNGDATFVAKKDFGISGDPVIGDWIGDSNSEYGVRAIDTWIPYYAFRINFTGTDGWSYFEFPYGNLGDEPVVWKPFSNNNQQNSNKSKIGSDLSETNNLPKDINIINYPNPFNPSTFISYTLPKNCAVLIGVYNVLGEKVRTIVDEEKQAGNYRVEFDGRNLASGIYIYRISAFSTEDGSKFEKSGKMLLTK